MVEPGTGARTWLNGVQRGFFIAGVLCLLTGFVGKSALISYGYGAFVSRAFFMENYQGAPAWVWAYWANNMLFYVSFVATVGMEIIKQRRSK